jgi:Ca2+-binding EF-hand superfamily protein
VNELKISIVIEAPEIAKAISELAIALTKRESINNNEVTESCYEQMELDLFPTTSQVTLEEVRDKLASLAQSGKQEEVKELIASFGASKLTEIPAEKYAELLSIAIKLNEI